MMRLGCRWRLVHPRKLTQRLSSLPGARQQDGVDDCEDCEIGASAEGQCRNGRRGEAQRSAELAKGVPELAGQDGERLGRRARLPPVDHAARGVDGADSNRQRPASMKGSHCPVSTSRQANERGQIDAAAFVFAEASLMYHPRTHVRKSKHAAPAGALCRYKG
jgi:hypothetical protein